MMESFLTENDKLELFFWETDAVLSRGQKNFHHIKSIFFHYICQR